MKKVAIISLIIFSLFIAGCGVNSKFINKTGTLEFSKEDFELSDPVTAEASEIRVFGIDFFRIFKKDMAMTDSRTLGIPIVGSFMADQANSYALYILLQENPGYDIIIAPKYETTKIGVPFFASVTKVKVTAILGKLKN